MNRMMTTPRAGELTLDALPVTADEPLAELVETLAAQRRVLAAWRVALDRGTLGADQVADDVQSLIAMTEQLSGMRNELLLLQHCVDNILSYGRPATAN